MEKKKLCSQQTLESEEQKRGLKKSASTIVIIPGENEIFDSVTTSNSLGNVKGKDLCSSMVEECNTYTTMKVPNWLIEGHEPKNVDSGLNFMHDWTRKNQINELDGATNCSPDPSTIIDHTNSADGSKAVPNWVIQGHAPIDVDHALCFMNQWTAVTANANANANADSNKLSSKTSKPYDTRYTAGKSKSTTGGIFKTCPCLNCPNPAIIKARTEAISKTNTSCDCKIPACKSKSTTNALFRTCPCLNCKNPAIIKAKTEANSKANTCCDCKIIAREIIARTRDIPTSKIPTSCCDCKVISFRSKPKEDDFSTESSSVTADYSEAGSNGKSKMFKKKLKSKKRKSKESQRSSISADDELPAQPLVDKNSSSSLAEFIVYQGDAQIRKRAKAEEIKQILSRVLGIQLGDMYNVEIKSGISSHENICDKKKVFGKRKAKKNDRTSVERRASKTNNVPLDVEMKSVISAHENINDTSLKRPSELDLPESQNDDTSMEEENANKINDVPLEVSDRALGGIAAEDNTVIEKATLVIPNQAPTLPSKFTFPYKAPLPRIHCCRCGRSNEVMNAVLKKLEAIKASQESFISPSRSVN